MGTILLGSLPGTTEYLEKSATPACSLRKSSPSRSCPFTTDAGAPRIANTAYEKIVGFGRSFSSSGSFCVKCAVAADSTRHSRPDTG